MGLITEPRIGVCPHITETYEYQVQNYITHIAMIGLLITVIRNNKANYGTIAGVRYSGEEVRVGLPFM